MQSSKLVIRSWQCHILWLFNQDLQWRTKFLGQLTRSALIFPTVPLSPKQCCCSLTLLLGGGYYSSFYKSWTNVENQFVFRNLKAQRWTSVEDPGRCVHHYCKCLLWNTCILMPRLLALATNIFFLFGKQLLRSAMFVVLIAVAAVIPFCWEVRIYNSFDLRFIGLCILGGRLREVRLYNVRGFRRAY